MANSNETKVTAPAPGKAVKEKKRKTVQYDRWGYFFIAPFFLVYIVFSFIPLITTFTNSFREDYRVGMKEEGPYSRVPRYFSGERRINDFDSGEEGYANQMAAVKVAFTELAEANKDTGKITPELIGEVGAVFEEIAFNMDATTVQKHLIKNLQKSSEVSGFQYVSDALKKAGFEQALNLDKMSTGLIKKSSAAIKYINKALASNEAYASYVDKKSLKKYKANVTEYYVALVTAMEEKADEEAYKFLNETMAKFIGTLKNSGDAVDLYNNIVNPSSTVKNLFVVLYPDCSYDDAVDAVGESYVAMLADFANKATGENSQKFINITQDLALTVESAVKKNFRTLFAKDDNLGKYLLNTVVMWIFGFLPQILISLLLAVWFTNTELNLKCQQFFKTVIYMPNLIMAAAFAMLFFNLFAESGPINNMIMGMVNKMNVPNLDKKLNLAITALTDFTKTNAGDTEAVNVINLVIAQLKEALTALPVKPNLVDANAFITSLCENAKVAVASYSGDLNLVDLIETNICVDKLPMEPIRFLSSAGWTRTLVAMMNFLMWYGNTTILLMAGVMGIDNSLFEAARIDGANPLQIFFKVTIPLLLPIFVYVLITSLIGGIQMFDVPQILTNGYGTPNRTTMTIIMKLNRLLQNKNYGPSGAASILIFIVTAILSGVVYKTTMQKYQNKR